MNSIRYETESITDKTINSNAENTDPMIIPINPVAMKIDIHVNVESCTFLRSRTINHLKVDMLI